MGAIERFPGAGVVREAKPSHHIFNSRKQRCDQHVLRANHLCAGPTDPHYFVLFIPLEQLQVLTARGGHWHGNAQPQVPQLPPNNSWIVRGPADATALPLRSLSVISERQLQAHQMVLCDEVNETKQFLLLLWREDSGFLSGTDTSVKETKRIWLPFHTRAFQTDIESTRLVSRAWSPGTGLMGPQSLDGAQGGE